MKRTPLLYGMVHLRALPGTPRASLSATRIAEIAVAESLLLKECGYDGAIIENMHDIPYCNRVVGPEIVSSMAIASAAVRQAVGPDWRLGVQVLAGANREALGIALTAGLNFIRAEGFVFAHVADEGIIQSDAAALLRYRKMIGAESIGIYADIKKKHSAHAITADVPLADTAHAAEFFLADAVIVTGSATGRPASPEDVAEAAGGTTLPALVGSGLAPENIGLYLPAASGFIVGSWVKRNGDWEGELDRERCLRFSGAFHAARDKAAARS
jgi:membrane complex biogenesis BtpA family protein